MDEEPVLRQIHSRNTFVIIEYALTALTARSWNRSACESVHNLLAPEGRVTMGTRARLPVTVGRSSPTGTAPMGVVGRTGRSPVTGCGTGDGQLQGS